VPLTADGLAVPPRFAAQWYLIDDLAVRRWTADDLAALDSDWPGLDEHTTDVLVAQALAIAQASALPGQVRAWLQALYARPGAVTSLMYKDGRDLVLHEQATILIRDQMHAPVSFMMHTGPDLVWALHQHAGDDHDRALRAFAAGLRLDEILAGVDLAAGPEAMRTLAAFNRPDLSGAILAETATGCPG